MYLVETFNTAVVREILRIGLYTTFQSAISESSRGAFQSIESVVNAVASVANMLSSTHNAVFSSFRAVIGVVEQFSMMKKQVCCNRRSR